MSVTVITDLAIKPEEVEWVISTLLSILPNTRKAEGCLGAELQQNQDDSNNLLIVQEFETREHYRAYMDASKSQGDPDGMMARYFASFLLLALAFVATRWLVRSPATRSRAQTLR